MRHLRIMVRVRARDRKPDAAAIPESPGGRDHGETELLRLILRHRLRVGAREGVERPAPALRPFGRGFLAMDGTQDALADVADRAVGADLGQIDMHRRIPFARGEPDIDYDVT